MGLRAMTAATLTAAAAAAAAGCGGGADGGTATAARGAQDTSGVRVEFPGPLADRVGKLAFVASAPRPDVYVAEPGRPPRNITNDHAEQAGVVWAPDGKRLAYSTHRNGTFDVVVANADGTGKRVLTELPANEYASSWSPDGRSLALGVEGPGERYAVYVARVADGHVRKIVQEKDCYVGDVSWAPDGTKLAVSVGALLELEKPRCVGGRGQDTFLVNPDGSDLRPLIKRRIEDASPRWSPDGRRLGFVEMDTPIIATAAADGSDRRRVGKPLAFSDARLAWGADGETILYVSESGSDIYAIPVSGGERVRLTENLAVTSVSAVAR